MPDIIIPSQETLSRRRFLSWLGGMMILPASPVLAQILGEFELGGESCDYFGYDDVPEKVHTFASGQEAEDTISRICRAVSLTPNFDIRAAGVPNAAAVIRGNKRYILYSRTFMHDMEQKVGNRWAPISIMAHEVGHHLDGHTLESGGSRPEIELRADVFSGGVLHKMKASLSDAQAVMKALGSDHGSATHPAKHQRLEAIALGWDESRQQVEDLVGTQSQNRTDSSYPRNEPAPNPRQTDPNSCEYARDGSCDEPDLCPSGTDTVDCSRRPAPTPAPAPAPNANPYPTPAPNYPNPTNTRATACCGSHGQIVCPMNAYVPLPRGEVCNCPGVQGWGLTCY